MDVRKRPERRQAVQEAKRAVRTYAREPSQANADAVEIAWRRVRQLDSLAQWRQAGAHSPMSQHWSGPEAASRWDRRGGAVDP
jgi:hypothetical protein